MGGAARKRRLQNRLQVGHAGPISRRYRAVLCHRCEKAPVVYRKHYCAECEKGSQHQRRINGKPATRRCRGCGERHQVDDFRAVMVGFITGNRVRHVDRCFRCEGESETLYHSLSPYHRAVIEVERASGLPLKAWVYGNNDWNDLHYERMVFHAGLRLPHGWQPLSPLYDLPMPAIVLYIEPEERDE